jgi:hypothetical protein
MDMGKEIIIKKGCKLLLDAFQFAGISSSNRTPKTKVYSSLGLTKVKYNIYRQSREENEKVKVQTSPNNLIHCANMWSTWLWNRSLESINTPRSLIVGTSYRGLTKFIIVNQCISFS